MPPFICTNSTTYDYTEVAKKCNTLTLGSTLGPCLSTGCPSLSMMNLVKFHLMKLQMKITYQRS